MRKIEENMLRAIAHVKDWREANTEVSVLGYTRETNVDTEYVEVAVYLHNNHIATVEMIRDLRTGNPEASFVVHNIVVNRETLARWPTRTTKSRLRALGAQV